MVAQPKPASYEFIQLGSTYRVLPDALRDLQTFSFWRIPGAEKEKQPGHRSGSKWIFTDWQKVGNLEWIGDALRLSRDQKVNVGLVVPKYWVVIDFDQCRDSVTGFIHPTVQRIIGRLKTVVLISSSGTGLHVFLKLTTGQQLPQETKFTNPDLYLDTFEDKKQGELKKPGTFVAIHWHPLPGYNALDKDVQQFPEWLEAELFIREEAAPHTEPSELKPLPIPLSTPQARPPREPEPKDTPFGIEWKSKYQAHVKAVFNGFNDPREESDTSISGRCLQWIRLYAEGSERPTLEGAVDLSKRVEGFYLSKQSNPRKEKSDSWHRNNAWIVFDNLLEDKRFGYLDLGERESKMPFDDRKLQAFNYALAIEMKHTTRTIFLTIVSLSEGRSRVKLRDAHIAKSACVHRDTVVQAKNELSNGSFLKIEGVNRNTYKFL